MDRLLGRMCSGAKRVKDSAELHERILNSRVSEGRGKSTPPAVTCHCADVARDTYHVATERR